MGQLPGDSYGWHEHSYEKVLYCVRGQTVFHTTDGDIELGRETGWCFRRTPLTRQPWALTVCGGSKRPASITSAEPSSATTRNSPRAAA